MFSRRLRKMNILLRKFSRSDAQGRFLVSKYRSLINRITEKKIVRIYFMIFPRTYKEREEYGTNAKPHLFFFNARVITNLIKISAHFIYKLINNACTLLCKLVFTLYIQNIIRNLSEHILH